MRLITLSIISLLFAACNAVNHNEVPKKKAHTPPKVRPIKGNVKSVITTMYYIDGETGDEDTMRYTVDTYNRNGDIVESNAYDIILGNEKATHSYTYGADGKLMETQYSGSDSGTVREVLRYDADGNLTGSETTVNGVPSRRNIYVYRDSNTLVDSIFDINGKLAGVRVSRFDSTGNNIQEDYTSGDNQSTAIQSYDSMSNVTRMWLYMHATLLTKQRFTYEHFDQAGNWLVQKEYHNEDYFGVTERTIAYY